VNLAGTSLNVKNLTVKILDLKISNMDTTDAMQAAELAATHDVVDRLIGKWREARPTSTRRRWRSWAG